MKIFTSTQVKNADKATIEKEGIPSINLMERAGGYVFEWIDKRLKGNPVPIKVFCGIGNNGGDGLVIARLLKKAGYTVKTYVVNYSDNRSDDFLKAYDSLKSETKTWPELIKSEDDFPEINPNEFVIDAIFGIGLNRPVDDWVQALFKRINESGAYVFSVDVPSGMFLDRSPKSGEELIKASTTLTFQVPKLIFFLPQSGKYSENWDIIDIGLDQEFIEQEKTQAELITKDIAQQMYRPRSRFSHKGTYGHAMICGGSAGKMGSVALSAEGCLRTGAGLVTAYVPQLGRDVLQVAVPEAMVLTDRHTGDYLEEIAFDMEPEVIGMGIGLGTAEQTQKALKEFLKKNKAPLVLDADAINCVSKNHELLQYLPNKTILTPHPKELQRLIGEWEDDFDKLDKAAKFAKNHDLIFVLKDAYTITVYDENFYVSATGNPGMATAGSGDVLTGIITGLVAQKYDPVSAAIFGVYLHGFTADLVAQEKGYEAMTSGDIVEFLGKGYSGLLAK